MIQVLTKNFLIKIVCLLLAFIFWYSIKAEEIVTTTVFATVKPVIGSKMIVTRIYPEEIKVTLAGNRRILGQLETETHDIATDLRTENETKVVRIELKASNFLFPEGAQVIKVEPKFVNIEIDSLIQKVFDVDALLEGEAAPNYNLAEIQTFPSRLRLTGPKKALENITVLKTEPIHIGGLSTSFMQTVRISEPYVSFKGAELIKVFVTINKSKVEKHFKGLPIRVLQPVGPPNNVTVKPALVDITVSGSNLDFQGIAKDSFIPYVEVSGLASGEYELPVHLNKKDNLKLKVIEPKSVEVSISGNR